MYIAHGNTNSSQRMQYALHGDATSCTNHSVWNNIASVIPITLLLSDTSFPQHHCYLVFVLHSFMYDWLGVIIQSLFTTLDTFPSSSTHLLLLLLLLSLLNSNKLILDNTCQHCRPLSTCVGGLQRVVRWCTYLYYLPAGSSLAQHIDVWEQT